MPNRPGPKKSWARGPDKALAQTELLIIGDTAGTNIGGSLLRGAQKLGISAHLLEARVAWRAPWLLAKVNWWLRCHRPTWLHHFSDQVVTWAKEMRPRWLLGTGFVPLTPTALRAIGNMGIQRIVFLTDDPWNPSHRPGWLFHALPEYDLVISPRRAVMEDLRQVGIKQLAYLPFGYDEDIFRAVELTSTERENYTVEVAFAGGADADRVPYFSELHRAGFQVALYGGFWERFPETRRLTRGYADPSTLCKVFSATKVAICLVRRCNRDGHAMRTFEVPAIGGAALLVEDTAEHREIFGQEGDAVLYFTSLDEMCGKTRRLLNDEPQRRRLAEAAHHLVTNGRHTYADRLAQMLREARQ